MCAPCWRTGSAHISQSILSENRVAITFFGRIAAHKNSRLRNDTGAIVVGREFIRPDQLGKLREERYSVGTLSSSSLLSEANLESLVFKTEKNQCSGTAAFYEPASVLAARTLPASYRGPPERRL